MRPGVFWSGFDERQRIRAFLSMTLSIRDSQMREEGVGRRLESWLKGSRPCSFPPPLFPPLSALYDPRRCNRAAVRAAVGGDAVAWRVLLAISNDAATWRVWSPAATRLREERGHQRQRDHVAASRGCRRRRGRIAASRGTRFCAVRRDIWLFGQDFRARHHAAIRRGIMKVKHTHSSRSEHV